MRQKMKERIKKKAQALRERLKGTVGLFLFSLGASAMVGCQSSIPASRANSTSYGPISINLTAVTNAVVTVEYNGDGILASADGGGDSQSADQRSAVTPTVSVPVNKAGASQSIGSAIGDAVASLFKGGSDKKSDECEGGACSDSESEDCPDCQDTP